MLFARLIHTKPLKINIPPGAKLGLHRTRYVNGALHIQLGDASLHDAKLEGNDACHFNGAAKGNLAVALAKVQVADAEFGAGNVHREVDFGAAREVLDVAVAAVFGAARDRARAFLGDFGFQVSRGAAGVRVEGLRRLRDDAVEVRVC